MQNIASAHIDYLKTSIMKKRIGIINAILALLAMTAILSCSGNRTPDQQNLPRTSIRLLEGDNPDPSIVRQGDTYYMVHSSFIYTPGLVVYKSKDLVNWTPCSTALPEYAGDVWAPDITIHDGRFYIYFPTRPDGAPKKTNMVVWADSPEGPWSQPVDLEVKGIDPEHVVDADGNRYLLLSSGDLHPLSPDGCSISGEPEIIYSGWEIPEEWDIESFSLEGLNIKKIGDYYYLLAAEGGTAGPPTGHMVVQARAKDVKGPWENAPSNPLLRTTSPSEKWWSQGHGSIVDTPDGKLYMLYHAYEKGYLTLGRQSMIRELEVGDDGWLRLKDGEIDLPSPVRKDSLGISDFIWQTFKESLDPRFSISSDSIVITGKGKSPRDGSPLLARAGDHSYELEATIELTGNDASAGLVVYYDDNMHFGLGFRQGELLRYRRGGVSHKEPAVEIPVSEDGKCRLHIRLRNTDNIINGWYSVDGRQWHHYPWAFDMQGYHHNTLGGFLSVRPGIYAGGDGKATVTDLTYRRLPDSQE